MKTKQILNGMHIISWIIFIGLCIKTGALIFSFMVSLFVNERATENLYLGLDLSQLYEYSLSHYVFILLLSILVSSLKAYLFYLIIKLFKSIDFNMPFNLTVVHLVSKMSFVSLTIGFIALCTSVYGLWLIKNAFIFFPINFGTSAYLFMAGVIFIVAFLLKRATEIQVENELTV